MYKVFIDHKPVVIIRKDDSEFKVYIDGDKGKYISFLNIATKTWNENK